MGERTPCSAVVDPAGGDTATVVLAGDVGAADRDALTGAWAEATTGATSGGAVRRVVLDLTDVAYLDSGGIAVLVGLLTRARSEGRVLAVRGLSAHYRRIFEITRLTDFVELAS